MLCRVAFVLRIAIKVRFLKFPATTCTLLTSQCWMHSHDRTLMIALSAEHSDDRTLTTALQPPHFPPLHFENRTLETALSSLHSHLFLFKVRFFF